MRVGEKLLSTSRGEVDGSFSFMVLISVCNESKSVFI